MDQWSTLEGGDVEAGGLVDGEHVDGGAGLEQGTNAGLVATAGEVEGWKGE